jgi:ubiquitin-conjugating enzyme E2 Z
MNEKKDNFVSKETISRLIRDIKNIVKNPLNDNGIYYSHDDTDLLKGYAMLVGSSETPYFSGFYFFEIEYPTDYPHSPPVLTYYTNGDGIRFNPNLYTSGKVCISILNTWRGEQWSSCQTITTLLLTLCTILCKDPLLNEPGITKTNTDFDKYNKIIEYENIDIAILKMFQKDKKYFNPKFEVFFPFMQQIFIKNSNQILEFLQKKINEPIQVISTKLYNMSVVINYKKLYNSYFSVFSNELSLLQNIIIQQNISNMDPLLEKVEQKVQPLDLTVENLPIEPLDIAVEDITVQSLDITVEKKTKKEKKEKKEKKKKNKKID